MKPTLRVRYSESWNAYFTIDSRNEHKDFLCFTYMFGKMAKDIIDRENLIAERLEKEKSNTNIEMLIYAAFIFSIMCASLYALFSGVFA